MKRGDLVRIVKRYPLPQFSDENTEKIGVVTNVDPWIGMRRKAVVIMIDGQLQIELVKNLEVIHASD